MAPKRILLVDDEPSVLRALGAFLEDEGYQVMEASDFKDATTLLVGGEFDVLITDLDLPGGNGLDLVRRARSLLPRLLPILVTGYGCSEVRRQAAELPLLAYLEKPINPDALLDLIQAPAPSA
jgi:DNA-binding NtrC family response regulator